MEALVEFRNVTKVYTDILGRRLAVGVEDLCASAEPGEVLAIVGPKGAGKTTAAMLLAGLLVPTRGRVLVGGMDPARLGRTSSPRIGLVRGSSGPAYRWLSVGQNLEYFAALRGLSGNRARLRISMLVEALGLGPVCSRRAGDLAQGPLARLALALALLPDPDVLVMDEPTLELDDGSRREVRSLLCRVLASGRRTAVLATERMEDALALASRVCVLRDGRMVAAAGSSSAILERGEACRRASC